VLLIIPIHSFVLVPIFVQMWSAAVMINFQKKDAILISDAYALNTPLLLKDSEIITLEDNFVKYDNSIFINQDDDFV